MTKQITKEGAGVVTQEFHISVTPVRDNEYWVRTEHVAPGVPLADEQFIWPVHDWLEQARHLMNDPLVGLLQGNSPSRKGSASSGSTNADPGALAEPSAKSLVALGRLLYESLFQGRLRDSWMTAQGIAQHRGEVLRLRLGLKGSVLPRLPWEVLNGGIQHVYAGSARPLATGTDILFSRYQPGMGMSGAIAFPIAPKPRQTLRLLMAIAAPNDQQQLKLKQEAEHLQQELKQQAELLNNSAMIGTLPDIRVTILEQPGREQLAQALEQGNYQIFHFAGHSELSSAGGQLYLVNRQTGLTEPMSGDDLAGLLVNNGIQMAVFNSCRGTYTASMPTNEEGTGDRSLTEALVSQGVPAVLAMAEQIPDDVALTLTRLFYRNLKQDYPVDLSLSRARQGLVSAYSSQQLYWALPILYMHPEFDGYLTSGDRALDNPADAFVGMPQTLAPSSLRTTEPSQYEPELLSQSVSEPDDAKDVPAIRAESSEITAVTRHADEADAYEGHASLDAGERGGDRSLVGDLAQSESEVEHGSISNHAADEAESSVTEHAESPELANASALENEAGQDSALMQDVETEIAADRDPQSLNDDSVVVEASQLSHDTAVDFFLPEDDLRVFDEGLTLEEEATSESELDEDVSTWSLVEELRGTDTPLNPTDRNGHADGSAEHDLFTDGVDDQFAQMADRQNGAVLGSTPDLSSDAPLEPGSSETNLVGEGVAPADAASVDLADIDAQANSSVEAAVGDISAAGADEESTEASSSDDSLRSTQDRNRHLQIVRSPHDLVSSEEEGDGDEVHRSRWRSPRRNLKKVLLLPLAGVAGAAVVMLGYNLFPTLDLVDSQTEVNQSNLSLDDLPQASTSEVVRFANMSFSQNDLSSGQAAVEELLNRGSVDEAQSALETVPDDQIEDPLITFLQGRLVWENLNEGKADAAIQDVSRYWTFAAQRAEDNPLYYNALGFAHYRQNRFHDAINAWQATLKTLEVQGEAVMPSQTTGAEVSYSIDVPSGAVTNPDALTAYAGIALALAQLSASTETQPYDALSRAIQMQQLVLQSDPSGFSPEMLDQSWLWTDSTIQEWQILTQIRPQ